MLGQKPPHLQPVVTDYQADRPTSASSVRRPTVSG
jgi:hypothetical protein